jgi:hypothetical protein
MKDRIKEAVEFLKEKQSFLVENLRLGINDSNIIQVTGWSSFVDFRNLTKSVCLEELESIKEQFSAMVNLSKELDDFIKGRDIEYILEFDDYGKTSIAICAEKNRHITWFITLK